MNIFDYSETRPNITKTRIKEVVFLFEPKQKIQIIYDLGYMKENVFERIESRRIILSDKEAVYARDGKTILKESLTEFSEFISVINSDGDLKETLKNLIKQRLGIK